MPILPLVTLPSSPSPSLFCFLLALILGFNPWAYPNSNSSTSPFSVLFHLVILKTSKCNFLITGSFCVFFIALLISRLSSPKLEKTKIDLLFLLNLCISLLTFHYFIQSFAASVTYFFSLLHALLRLLTHLMLLILKIFYLLFLHQTSFGLGWGFFSDFFLKLSFSGRFLISTQSL